MLILQCMYRYYILAFIDSNLEIQKELRGNVVNAITEVSEYNGSKTDVIKDSHRSLLEAIKTTSFAQLQKESDSQLSNQSRFLRRFMKLFELLLLFIRASRDQLWKLHLQSLHTLCPYFLALDMINFARMTPVYLSQMYALKEILKLGNFYPTKDFQLTNRKFHFLPLDQITEFSKKTVH